jgi:glutathione S-transferase
MQAPTPSLRLYWFPLSGHAHRAELMLSLLGLTFHRILVNLSEREQKAPEFLAKNPFGQVPVLEDGGVTVADSTAILVYLAKRYDPASSWLPEDAALAARVQRWLAVAAGPLAQGPAAARAAVVFRKQPDAAACERAQQLLQVLESELATREYLVGSGPTIADVALYTYTAHVPEGGVSLEPYAAVRAWLSRIEGLPGFVGMRKSPLPESS